MANIYDMADTWNDSGTVFTAIKMNVTNTASSADSLLMDLQVGGTTQASVNLNGDIYARGNVKAQGRTGAIIFDAISNYFVNTSYIGGLRWGQAGGSGLSNYDLVLARDDAGILAQRDGTNPQEFRLYNTYTNSTDYERGYIKHTASGLDIGTEASGTGTRGNLYLRGGSATHLTLEINQTYATFQRYSGRYTRFRDGQIESVSNSGDAYLSLDCTDASAGSYVQMTESLTAPSAPSADAVRIYAEDNGSGKTRLMALFPTGAAQQIAIEP